MWWKLAHALLKVNHLQMCECECVCTPQCTSPEDLSERCRNRDKKDHWVSSNSQSFCEEYRGKIFILFCLVGVWVIDDGMINHVMSFAFLYVDMCVSVCWKLNVLFTLINLEVNSYRMQKDILLDLYQGFFFFLRNFFFFIITEGTCGVCALCAYSLTQYCASANGIRSGNAISLKQQLSVICISQKQFISKSHPCLSG